MTIEANFPLLGTRGTHASDGTHGTHGTQSTVFRRISPSEQLDWIFDESPTATVVEIRSDRWTEKTPS